MAKNADEPADDDSAKVTEEDLRKDKYGDDGVESTEKSEEDETTEDESTEEDSEETGEGDSKTDDQTEEEESEETDETVTDEDNSEFVKEFPNIKGDTLEAYARELERTLQLSNTEGKRLSEELKAAQTSKPAEKAEEAQEDTGPVDPRLLYAEKMINNDAQRNFEKFKQKYPQADPETNPAGYAKFEEEVSNLTGYYLSKKQILTADELYPKVASILGWEPVTETVDNKEKLGMAIKNRAAITKTSSSSKPAPKKSKVTDAMIAANRLMYPNKTDAEIRKELEPYVK